MTRRAKISLSLAAAVILLSSYAANAVLNMGGKTIFAGTVIEVLEPGPATQIQDIITNITDASATNPYLIQLGPGVYDLGSVGIVTKQWVSIQGSGQEATKITGLVSSGIEGPLSAIVVGSDDAVISNMTIENAGGTVSIAIYNFLASPRIEQVNAIASGTSAAYGIYNTNDCSPIMTNVIAAATANSVASVGVLNFSNSSPSMTNVTASGSGGAYARGIWNLTSSSPNMTNVTAEGIDGATYSYGVLNEDSSSPRMINVIATASSSGAFTNSGVFNDKSSPTMINVTASASGGTNSYGVYISADSPGTRVVNSKIINGIYNEADGTQCRGNYDSNLLDVICELPPKPPATSKLNSDQGMRPR